MLADLCVHPLGVGNHISPILAAVLKVVKGSGLAYQLTPTSTCVEGTFAELSDVIAQCHDVVAAESPHFVISLRLEEDGGERGKLAGNVASVERRAGEPLATSPEEATRHAAEGAPARRKSNQI